MAGSIDIADTTRVGSTSWWAGLLSRAGLRGDGAPAATVARPELQLVRDELPLFLPAIPRAHAELFMSERTGDWIRVGCGCALGVDHWHAVRAG